MTPKEKAKQLVEYHCDKMFDLRDGYNPEVVYEAAKLCALVTIDEIMKELDNMDIPAITSYNLGFFWQEVKQEIEKI